MRNALHNQMNQQSQKELRQFQQNGRRQASKQLTDMQARNQAGIARITSLGAALTASAVIGFFGVHALTGDGDASPTRVATDSNAEVSSVPDWPAAVDIATSSSLAKEREQRAFLDQFTADLIHR